MSTKKLSLEERLSLATKKGRKKNKKVSGLESPGSGISLNESTDDITASEVENRTPDRIFTPEIPVSLDKEPKSTENDETKAQPESITFSLNKNIDPWKTWLPEEFEELNAQDLMNHLGPHIQSLYEQSKQESQRQNCTKRTSSDNTFFKLIREKDELITLLREEGKKLAKTELRQSDEIKELKKKVRNLANELADTVEKLSVKVDDYTQLHQTYTHLQSQLTESNTTVEQLNRENAQFNELKQTLENKDNLINELKTSLDIAQQDLKNAKIKSDAEMNSLRIASQEEATTLESKVEQLRIEMENLKDISISSNDKMESQGLTTDTGAALNNDQYKILKEQFAASKDNWHSIEYALTTRLADLESQVNDTKKENAALTDQQNVNVELYSQLETTLREQKELKHANENKKNILEKELTSLKNSMHDLNEDHKLLQKKYDLQRVQLGQRIDSLPKLQLPAGALDNDEGISPRTADSLEDEWGLPPVDISLSQSEIKESYVDSLPPISEDLGSNETEKQAEQNRMLFDDSDMPEEAADLQRKISRGDNHTIAESNNSFQMLRRVSTATHTSNQMNAQMVSRLGSEMRRMEAEVVSLKELCDRLQKEKNNTNDEILRLLDENETAQHAKVENASLEKQINDVQNKLDTSLQLLGEKTEQVEELQNDVSDLKEMMQQQVQQLVAMQNE